MMENAAPLVEKEAPKTDLKRSNTSKLICEPLREYLQRSLSRQMKYDNPTVTFGGGAKAHDPTKVEVPPNQEHVERFVCEASPDASPIQGVLSETPCFSSEAQVHELQFSADKRALENSFELIKFETPKIRKESDDDELSFLDDFWVKKAASIEAFK